MNPDNSQGAGPLFSVVIPVYNRESEICRALASVLTQEFTRFQVIVVDDGSTDGSATAAQSFHDGRVMVLRHDANRGPCPARNAGVDRANGEWIVFLDSDDELVPGALELLSARIREAPDDVDRLACMYRWDDGRCSPEPGLQGQVLDYRGYLSWLTIVHGRSDFLNCVRRSTFARVRLPDTRAYEAGYHLDFAREFKTWMLPDVSALEHQDSPNRAANLHPHQRVQNFLRDAPDGLSAVVNILDEHGESLKKYAPSQWRLYCRLRVMYSLLCGYRMEGLRYTWACIRDRGWQANVFAILFLGMVGPRLLASVLARR